MASLLDRLLGREKKEPPLTARERRHLEHRYRTLERQHRRASKGLDRRGCSTCVKAEDPMGVALAKRVRAMEDEMSHISRRLSRDA